MLLVQSRGRPKYWAFHYPFLAVVLHIKNLLSCIMSLVKSKLIIFDYVFIFAYF